jgi:hypothetical protein
MRPVATFFSYACGIKLHNNFGGFVPRAVIFTRSALEPSHSKSYGSLAQKMDTQCSRTYSSGSVNIFGAISKYLSVPKRFPREVVE